MSLIMLACMALAVSAGCNQLTVSAPDAGFAITDWNFMYQHGNETDMICGNAPYAIVGTPEGINVQLTVTEQSYLVVSANVTYTDMVGRNYTRMFIAPAQTYYPGYYSVDLVSEYNYQVGTYDVVQVKAIKV